METATLFVLLAAIACAWGSDDALGPNDLKAKFVNSGGNDVKLSMVKSTEINNSVVKPLNGLQEVPIEPFTDNMDRAVKPCGTHTLKPGETVNISGKTKKKCIWKFEGTSTMSKISIKCRPFNPNKCKKTTIKITGGTFNKKYCGKKKKMIVATSTNNKMEVDFKSNKPKPAFQCTVSASDPCGIVTRATRIVGGVETAVNEYPWQVAIVKPNSVDVICGGVVYNENHVVTAAHCKGLVEFYGNLADVLLGVHDLRNLATAQKIPVTVNDFITDGSYNVPYSFDHDIAVLKLSKPATFNDKVIPACLPKPNSDYTGVNAVITGWGLTNTGLPSNVLRKVEVPIISKAACQNVYGLFITDNMICTLSPSGGKDKCIGDNGGPLVVEENNIWTVVGIGSWAVGCGLYGFPGGYEKVSNHLMFLANNTK